MNTFKNKTRILTYLICFSVLSLINISCENNDDFEEIIEQTDKVKKAEAKNAAKANIKTGRTRVKQRPNNLYRTTVTVKDNNNEVNAVALEIEQKEGFIKETKTYYLEYFTTLKGEKYYTFGDIKFENKEIENQEVTVNITFLDAKKEVISKTTEVVVVAGLAKANIKTGRTRLKRRPNGLYKLTAEIEDPENDVATVELTITDLKGNKAIINTVPKKNNTIKADFSFQKESIANTFLVISSLKDMFGDVVGESKEEVVVTTFSNVNIKRTRLKRRANGLYNLKGEIINDPKNEVAEIEISVDDLKGNITTFTTIPNKNNTINTNFNFDKKTDATTFIVTFSFKNKGGRLMKKARRREQLFAENNY